MLQSPWAKPVNWGPMAKLTKNSESAVNFSIYLNKKCVFIILKKILIKLKKVFFGKIKKVLFWRKMAPKAGDQFLTKINHFGVFGNFILLPVSILVFVVMVFSKWATSVNGWFKPKNFFFYFFSLQIRFFTRFYLNWKWI